MSASYEEFLRSKVKLAEASGVALDVGSINPALKPHQRVIVEWLFDVVAE